VFFIGGEYENRRGRYTVLSIDNDVLHVRYADGSIDSLNAQRQKDIVLNFQKEKQNYVHVNSNKSPQRPVISLPALDWLRYNLWNGAIFSHFFNESVSGRLVYIDVDDEEITKISPDEIAIKAPVEDFIKSTVSTLVSHRRHLLDLHINRLNEWKKGGSLAPPPFIAILTLFCMTAQRMHRDNHFGVNNYYDRLSQTILGLRYTNEQKQDLWAGFQNAYIFWDELEIWLQAQGGRYGLPSAQPMYGFSHVGYPISQALLRAPDRTKLIDLFLWAELDPGREMSPGDIERLMNSWVPDSQLSQAAKKSWNTNAARRRMAEVASLELSSWDGTVPIHHWLPNNIEITTTMAIEALIVKGPKPRVIWRIVFRMPPGLSEVSYKADDSTNGLPTASGYKQTVLVNRGLEERWSEPISDVSIADILESSIYLTCLTANYKAKWQPRKVLVFNWDDEIKVYRSQSHLEFGRRGMVLAYKSIAPKVRNILMRVDAGEMCQVPESCNVPSDWILFEGVQPMRIPDTGNDPDLETLVPEIWSSVNWIGGIALPGRKQWIGSRLPIVKINSIDQIIQIKAEIHCKIPLDGEKQNIDRLAFETSGNALDIALSTLTLHDGIYGLTVMAYRTTNANANGDIIQKKTFEIRSSDSPVKTVDRPLSHISLTPLWSISATSEQFLEAGSNVTLVNGASVQPLRYLSNSGLIIPDVPTTSSKATEEDLFGYNQKLERTRESIAECFRGVHHFQLPTYHGTGPSNKAMQGVCIRCGLKKVFHPAGWNEVLSRTSSRAEEIPRKKDSDNIVEPPIMKSESQIRDYNGLLEACFTLGGGSWSHFELLARQAGNDSMFPYEAIQIFSALGHIDIEYDKTGRHFVTWKVAPTMLVSTESGHWFVAGFRSTKLLDAIRHAVEESRGLIDPLFSKDGPTMYSITGLNRDAILNITKALNVNQTVKLTIADRADRSIAAILPPLSHLLTNTCVVSPPAVAEFFDANEVSWIPKTFASYDGLYRTDSMPRLYNFLVNGSWYSVSYRVGKHLACALLKKVLLAYDAENQQLECPLGAQLPGLYERAVVLSSGLPPEIDLSKAKVIYRNVPQDVASAVWSKVYGTG
jgi:hypothetical protein